MNVQVRTKGPAKGSNPVGASAVRVRRAWFVSYPLEHAGIPLAKTSSALAVVRTDGRVTTLRGRNIPKTVDATTPRQPEAPDEVTRLGLDYSRGVVDDAAKYMKRTLPDNLRMKASPASLEIWVDKQLDGHLTWTYVVQSSTRRVPHAYRYWVSAIGTPKIVHKENLVYTDHEGRITGDVLEGSPFGQMINVQLADLQVGYEGSDAVAVTDSDGRYRLPGAGHVTARLQGPHCIIDDDSGDQPMERGRDARDGAVVDLNFDTAANDPEREHQLAELSAFYWTGRAYEFLKAFLAKGGAPVPDRLSQLHTHVNINDCCNANWQGANNTLNFFHAGTCPQVSCPNTGYRDVVLHEYGHAIDASYGEILDPGYSEGFGDSYALLVMANPDDSCVGHDLFGPGTCLRDAAENTPDQQWPPNNDEVHFVGRIYAGFTCDLIHALLENNSKEEAYDAATTLVLGAGIANPANIPDAVRLSFVVDGNGLISRDSPHFNELKRAAESRNIPLDFLQE